MQLNLLPVLREGNFERVGKSVTGKADLRIIAVTNIDLEQAIRQGKFPEDLYYRLNVIPAHSPPLCDNRSFHFYASSIFKNMISI